MILEDDMDFAEMLKMDLVHHGYEVDVTDSGNEAFELLSQQDYDLLIADIYIWKDGQVARDGGLLLTGRLQNIRVSNEKDRRGSLPIIVISGAARRPGQHHILDVAKSLGADAVLAKPFAPEDLHNMIDRLLASYRP
ncbi:hypothetical protein ATO3_06175 [Marinibacterium profundimaris]|uniref:Response regulatory domain-containing protein n=2 Tax=Marinibacterium profundimaris TaxID=1679460 RepID=A0A225NRS9_9RHOB|nr:hypothetical protein ATO3_06175 [Marinibacterium profundimaris]